MKLQWSELAVVTALMGASCIAIYAGLAHAMRRAVRERQQELERRLNAMETSVKALQARVVELGRLQWEHSPEVASSPHFTSADQKTGEKREGMKPELVAVLTAAASTFLGKKAHIRSAQMLPPEPDSAGAWAQQGRVIVQSSHNLRPRE